MNVKRSYNIVANGCELKRNKKKEFYIEWNTLHNNTSSSASSSINNNNKKKLHNAPKIQQNKTKIMKGIFNLQKKCKEAKDGIYMCIFVYKWSLK